MELNLLSIENRQFIWDASKMNDEDVRRELQKTLIGAASAMSFEDRNFFISKIADIAPKDLMDRNI